MSWVNVKRLGAFVYEQRHAACRGVLWGSLILGSNSFLLLYFIFSSHLSNSYALIFFPSFVVVHHRPANKKVPNKNIVLTVGSNLTNSPEKEASVWRRYERAIYERATYGPRFNKERVVFVYKQIVPMEIPRDFRLQATTLLALDGSLFGRGVIERLRLRWFRGRIPRKAQERVRRVHDYRVVLERD